MHYVSTLEVWGAANVLEAEIGWGRIWLSTMNILTYLGTDHVAEKILFNMIEFVTKQQDIGKKLRKRFDRLLKTYGLFVSLENQD